MHMVDFILGNSRTENVPDEEEGNTPLHIATLTDNPQCIKLLLNHNANLNASEPRRREIWRQEKRFLLV